MTYVEWKVQWLSRTATLSIYDATNISFHGWEYLDKAEES